MEPSYMILGGDGNQYGPVTAEEFRAWLREGRVNGATQVWRNDQPAWMAAAALPELGASAPAAAGLPPSIPANVAAQNPELEGRVRSGASWFYWIAAMSLINSFLVLTKQSWGFALGLGITQEIDHALPDASTAAKAVVFMIDLAAAAVVAMFGFFATKKHAWSFIVGMVLLALDTALTVFQQSWLSTAFHVWALFSIFMAFKASRALRA